LFTADTIFSKEVVAIISLSYSHSMGRKRHIYFHPRAHDHNIIYKSVWDIIPSDYGYFKYSTFAYNLKLGSENRYFLLNR